MALYNKWGKCGYWFISIVAWNIWWGNTKFFTDNWKIIREANKKIVIFSFVCKSNNNLIVLLEEGEETLWYFSIRYFSKFSIFLLAVSSNQ